MGAVPAATRVTLRFSGLSGSSLQDPPGRLLCVPSQNGAAPVRLQPQKMTSSSRSAVKANGSIALPACDPSQNGCDFERPQRHQW